MHSRNYAVLAVVAIVSLVFAANAAAAPAPAWDMAREVMDAFTGYVLNDEILDAAKALFWSLATISLVWTMGMLIVRQDIGEMLMELLRFMVVTGIFYWLLINASTHQGGQGFVDDIVSSFLKMVNGDTSDDLIRSKANSILARGLYVFYIVMSETSDGDMADRILSGGMAIAILAVCAVMAAQFVLALVMAWILGYAGIFLLGFGGARWTSSIAINFYKHVLAVGIAILALSIVGTVASAFLENLKFHAQSRGYSQYPYLGLMLGVSILMMVLSIKVPQLLYTVVTGSTLGLYTGAASVAGSAIASAGASALAGVSGHFPGGGGHTRTSGGSGSVRTESVMDAVHRSASNAGGMSDPFHVGAGADSFGVSRSADPYRQSLTSSVFATAQAANESTASGVGNLGTQGLASEASQSVGGDAAQGPGAASDKRFGNDSTSRKSLRGAHGRADEKSGEQVGGATAIVAAAVPVPDYEAELATIEASRTNTGVGAAATLTSVRADESFREPIQQQNGEPSERLGTSDMSAESVAIGRADTELLSPAPAIRTSIDMSSTNGLPPLADGNEQGAPAAGLSISASGSTEIASNDPGLGATTVGPDSTLLPTGVASHPSYAQHDGGAAIRRSSPMEADDGADVIAENKASSLLTESTRRVDADLGMSANLDDVQGEGSMHSAEMTSSTLRGEFLTDGDASKACLRSDAARNVAGAPDAADEAEAGSVLGERLTTAPITSGIQHEVSVDRERPAMTQSMRHVEQSGIPVSPPSEASLGENAQTLVHRASQPNTGEVSRRAHHAAAGANEDLVLQAERIVLASPSSEVGNESIRADTLPGVNRAAEHPPSPDGPMPQRAHVGTDEPTRMPVASSGDSTDSHATVRADLPAARDMEDDE